LLIRKILSFIAGITLALLMTSLVQAGQKKLFIFNFANYFAEDTIANFMQKTGIDVHLDYFDTAEMMEARLLVGKSGYDVAFANSPSGSRLVAARALAKIDRSRLQNYANLDPLYLELLQQFDPGNDYMVPYMMATTGIAYNMKAIAARMPDAPIDSLDMFFKPEVAAKFADCGIAINDSPSEIIPIALNYLGLDPYSSNRQDIEKAADLLASLRPHIRHMNTGQIIDDLAAGEICLALTWDGDANIARAQAALAGGDDIAYQLPRQGTTIAFDSMVIPADAANIDEAYQFIDSLLEPQIIASISNEVYFPNPNNQSLPFLSAEMVTNMELLGRSLQAKKLFLEKKLGPQEMQEREQIWARFRAGQ